MNTEWLTLVVLTLSGFLFAAGGTDINGHGYKEVRRYLLPLALGILAAIQGVGIASLWMALSLTVVFCLPYGDKTPWWGKVLVGISYSLPSLFIHITFWQIVLPILFILMFWGSKKNWIPWIVWEFIVGVLVALTIV